MELFKVDSKIDFMGLRKYCVIFSLLIFVFSTATLLIKGLHWGLDFTGGTQIEVSYEKSADLSEIRNTLTANGFSDSSSQVQSFGSSKDVLISIAPEVGIDPAAQADKILSILPGATKQRVETVGPQVGQELASKGLLAIIISMLLTMLYIAIRFEYRFAVSSAVALIHDPLLILGVFSFWQIEFDLKALAALLAVIGYSLNDTIVVFDRVRENFRKVRQQTPVEIMNLSINQTLSRTIMTSALTLIVVVALFLFGGQAIHGFALALMIGIIIGTYSSIYIAGALAIAMGLSRADLMPSVKTDVEQIP